MDQIPAVPIVVTGPNDQCVVAEQWVGRVAVVVLSGVLDMLTSPRLEAAVAEALRKGPSALIVDLTNVNFLASAGMSALLAARDQVGSSAAFAVVADGPATSRPLTLVGLADAIGLYQTVPEACAAVGADAGTAAQE